MCMHASHSLISASSGSPASMSSASRPPQSPHQTTSGVRWPQIILFGDSLTQIWLQIRIPGVESTCVSESVTEQDSHNLPGLIGAAILNIIPAHDPATKAPGHLQRSFGVEGGWGAKLAHELQRKCDVLSRGFSGYNTRWARMILPQLITPQMAPHVHLVTICLGANDAARADRCPHHHVPLEEFKNNLGAMVEYLLSLGIERNHILMISNPPCDEEKWERHCIETEGCPVNRNSKWAKIYSEACTETAKRLHIPCVNLHEKMMSSPNWKPLLNDGLHLSALGGDFVFEQIWPWFAERTSKLPTLFPLWDEVDYRDPARSLTPGAVAE